MCEVVIYCSLGMTLIPRAVPVEGEEESGEGSEEERVIEKARKRKKNVSTKAL